VFLHLCYHGVTTNIIRRLVRSTALAPLCVDTTILSTVRQIAYDAAHEALNFATNLRSDDLEAFWYFGESSLCALQLSARY
jgi:hypothetical protein